MKFRAIPRTLSDKINPILSTIILILVYFTPGLHSQTIEKPTQSAIQSVQVFSDQAEVTRSISADVSSGSNILLVRDLPHNIIDDSLRVRISGGDTTQNHNTKILAIDSSLEIEEGNVSDEVKQAEDELKKAESLLRNLTDQYSALKEEEKSLRNIKLGQIPDKETRKNTTMGINTQQWIKTLDFIQLSLSQNYEKMETLLDRIDSAREDLNLASFVVERLRSKTSRKSKTIRIDLESNQAKPINLLLSYRIPDASWYPIYSAKVFPKGDEADVAFQFFAMLKNDTGEDWKNIKLSFSAADPNISIHLPDLQSWFIQSKREATPSISPRKDLPMASPKKKYATKQLAREPSPQQQLQYQTGNQSIASAVQEERSMRKSQAVEKEIQTIKSNIQRRDESLSAGDYNKAINYSELTIRSIENVNPKFQKYLVDEKKKSEYVKRQALDRQENESIIRKLVSPLKSSGGFSYVYKAGGFETVDSDGAFHKVYITQKTWKSGLHYEANPNAGSNAYLVGTIRYLDDVPLLSGPVSIFHNRDYVGDSLLPNVSQKEEFQLHLGASQDISVKRNQESVREKTGILTKNFTFQNKINIHIKNARKAPSKILVFDRIPYSTDSRAKISNIRTSIPSAKKDDSFGLFRFDLNLNPGKEENIEINYNLTHPESIVTDIIPEGAPGW